MISVEGSPEVGEIKAYTTSYRGLTPEEIADMALPKILHVADTAAPSLKDQARIFKEQLRLILISSMKQAIKSDRTTLYNKLRGTGHTEVAEIIIKV